MTQQVISTREKWESRYCAPDYEPEREPVPFLVEAIGRLVPGKALCLAAGAGRNAIHLSESGFSVTAVDISPSGLAWCRRLAMESGLSLETIEADLTVFDFREDHWDLETNFYYYEPSVFPRIAISLKRGGHFLFQTYSKAQKNHKWGPKDPKHLVEPEQLWKFFSDWYQDCFAEVENTLKDGKKETVIQMLVQKP